MTEAFIIVDYIDHFNLNKMGISEMAKAINTTGGGENSWYQKPISGDILVNKALAEKRAKKHSIATNSKVLVLKVVLEDSFVASPTVKSDIEPFE